MSYAAHFAMNGGSLKVLEDLLGHSSSQMTERYAHLPPGFLASKAGVVGFSWKPKVLCASEPVN